LAFPVSVRRTYFSNAILPWKFLFLNSHYCFLCNYNHTEEVLFIINMKRAWQFLLDNLEYDNNLMLLREYNKIVGEIRTIPVQTGGTSWGPEMPHTGVIIDNLKDIEQIEDAELKAL